MFMLPTIVVKRYIADADHVDLLNKSEPLAYLA